MTNPVDTWMRIRISVSGTNLICEKTTPSDINYNNATIYTTTIDSEWTTDNYVGFNGGGGLAYANVGGIKFAMGDGNNNSHYSYSYNSNYRFYMNNPLAMSISCKTLIVTIQFMVIIGLM